MPRAPAIVLVSLLQLATACSERVPSAPRAAPALTSRALTCRADVRAGTLSCAAPGATGGVSGASQISADVILGGQGIYVQLSSSNVSYDATTQIFRADVTLQNLTPLILGTPDGTTATGVKVFFWSGPSVVSGTGAVSVANADGVGTFTGTNQPFFLYDEILPPGTVSATRTWQWAVPNTVGTFVFEVLVDAALPPPGPMCSALQGTAITETRLYAPYKALMEQVSRLGPAYVTSNKAVDICALEWAGYMLDQMLQARLDVTQVLRSQGVLTAVFGRTQGPCDLPYFSDLVGTDSCTAGGLGGVPGRDATACSERNLLMLPDDPFLRGTPGGENTCVHELGHTVMNIGLSADDRDAIRLRYEAAKTEGLWNQDAFGNPTFALQSADEFFAEMTQTYFCANPQVPAYLHNGVNCSDELRTYDPRTFDLIDGIYRRSGIDLR